ncbi:MAG: glycosyltransferase, partial [Asgard group archaeon]|nr:glycosyltransferase [Asgard group archaeon]
ERNIENCLKSLRKLDYSNYEIIVSDGGSTDNTVKIAKKYANKVIVDEHLPDGWIGKNWGCHLGYKYAEGDYFLFTDADTSHTPPSLKRSIIKSQKHNAALYTMLPYQKLIKWWESIIPIYFFTSHLISGGYSSVNDPEQKDKYMGNGQYLLFTREAYESIGGHLRVKGSIVEDLAFSRIIKVQLGKLFIDKPKKYVSTRMYPDSLKQCWNGWNKNVFAGTKFFAPHKIMGTLSWILWGLFAPGILVLFILYWTWPYYLAAAILYTIFPISLIVYWKDQGRHYWVTYAFYPILLIFFCITLGVSALNMEISKTATWRGRVYEPDLYVGTNKEEKDYSNIDEQLKNHLDKNISVEINEQLLKKKTINASLTKEKTPTIMYAEQVLGKDDFQIYQKALQNHTIEIINSIQKEHKAIIEEKN